MITTSISEGLKTLQIIRRSAQTERDNPDFFRIAIALEAALGALMAQGDMLEQANRRLGRLELILSQR